MSSRFWWPFLPWPLFAESMTMRTVYGLGFWGFVLGSCPNSNGWGGFPQVRHFCLKGHMHCFF
jgi:hypothetical protein